MNWIAKRIHASIAKLLLTAIQPNIKGIAPGKAPTKTDNEEILFNGV